MRQIIFSAVVPFIFCGCGCVAEPVPAPYREPVLPDELQLAEIPVAQPLDPPDVSSIFIQVNELGELLLVPEDEYIGSDGLVTRKLGTIQQIEIYLKRKARFDLDAADLANKKMPPRSVIVLRIHKDCPYEKSHPVLIAARRAGFEKFQWRVRRSATAEGQIPMFLPSVLKADAKAEFVAQVTSDGMGKIAKIILRGPGSEKELDIQGDVGALFEKLKEQAVKQKENRARLSLQIDGKLLQADVIRLIDGGIQAGFTDISPVMLEPKQR